MGSIEVLLKVILKIFNNEIIYQNKINYDKLTILNYVFKRYLFLSNTTFPKSYRIQCEKIFQFVQQSDVPFSISSAENVPFHSIHSTVESVPGKQKLFPTGKEPRKGGLTRVLLILPEVKDKPRLLVLVIPG